MKTFAKILSLLLLAITTFAATPIAKASAHSDEESTIQMRILGNDHVSAGSAITAELTATLDAKAELIVENSSGKRFVHTSLDVNQGFNLVKFKVSEVPSGIYFVKVKSDDTVKYLSFVVR